MRPGSIALLTVLMLPACREATAPDPVTLPHLSIRIFPDSATLVVGQGLPLQFSLSNGSGPVEATWESRDPTIATVSAGGGVVGIAAGATSVTLHIRQGARTASATAVIQVAPVPALTIVPHAIFLVPGQQQTLAVVVEGIDNPEIRWTSLSPEIASVSAAGRVQGVSAGTSRIQATLVGVPGLTAEAAVLVVSPSIGFQVEGVFRGGTTDPIDLAGVTGVIDVLLRVDDPDPVDRVVVLLNQVPVANADVTTPPVAPAQAGPRQVTLAVDTRSWNGAVVLSALLYRTGQPTPLASNAIPMTVVRQ